MIKQVQNNHFRPSAAEIIGVLLFYLIFSFLYHLTIEYVSVEFSQRSYWAGVFSFTRYWYSAGMQYLFFFAGSVLIWFIAIRSTKRMKTVYRILLVLALIPIVVFVVRDIRYSILDDLGLGRLQGAGTVWDLYIPFLFLMFQFSCFFAYDYFKETQNRLIVENELRQAALKSELAALKAQLNPHFLFNVFNTINSTIPKEHEETRSLTADLADLFRYQLQASKADLVPLGDEIDFLRKYLHLEQARFEDRLQVSINVDESLMNYPIPPMILQPLVENSLRHGLSSLVEGGSISISIQKTQDKLHFSIADTGIGIADKKAIFENGTGLKNTKLRLENMYNSTLRIEDNEPKGTTISFEI